MEFFGQAAAEGTYTRDDGRSSIEAEAIAIRRGRKIAGTVRGVPGRVEVFRMPAPREMLVNNWQSWGPIEKTSPGQRPPGVEKRTAAQGPHVFTPIPAVFPACQVSDYFVAWEGGLAGFLSSKIGHPYFIVEGTEIVACLEYFGAAFEDRVPLESLVILEGGPVEALCEEYAVRVAVENEVRVNPWSPVGWSTWYQYFTDLRLQDIDKNLRLARESYPFEVFEIDDGYESDVGDWLKVKDGFCPLPDLAGRIRGFGFEAGLWTAPFCASETSDLARLHPEWLIAEGGRPKPCFPGWGKNVFALDVTNPGAKNWIYETFVSLKRMGFDYFKIDFVFAAAMDGPRTARTSPIQAYREGLSVIRSAVGDSFVLGCGAPLLPSVGFVDAMRIGEDTAPFWDSSKAPFDGVNALYALRNSILRAFMHKKWWLNDPDCLLLRRAATSLSDNEIELYARTAGALDNLISESDDLESVDEWGRGLLTQALRLKGGHVRVRGMMAEGLYLIDSWGGPSGTFRFAANLSDEARRQDGRDVPPRTGIFIKPE